MNKQIKWITRTALLLALALLFQSLRGSIPKVMIPGLGEMDQYIIGSLVNTTLILGAVTVGFTGGLVIAIVTPLVALLQGEIAFQIMMPFVALGNVAIVLFVSLFYKRNKILAFGSGIIAKFLTLLVTINLIVIPYLTPTLPTEKAGVVSAMLSFKFGYPQLITATLGAIIAYALIPVLESSFRESYSYQSKR